MPAGTCHGTRCIAGKSSQLDCLPAVGMPLRVGTRGRPDLFEYLADRSEHDITTLNSDLRLGREKKKGGSVGYGEGDERGIKPR